MHNYTFTRLRILILSLNTLILIILIVYLVYTIYTNPIHLCDGTDSIADLKVKLTNETANYRSSLVRLQQYSDLREQLHLNSGLNNVDNNLDQQYYDTIKTFRAQVIEGQQKINHLCLKIKSQQPSFNWRLPPLNSVYTNIGTS